MLLHGVCGSLVASREPANGSLSAPNRQALHCGTPPENGTSFDLWPSWQSSAEMTKPEQSDIPTSWRLASWLGKCACLLPEMCLFWTLFPAMNLATFVHINFSLCFFLPIKRGPGWIFIPFDINAYPHLSLLLTWWHSTRRILLLHSYSVQAQSKHWMLPST